MLNINFGKAEEQLQDIKMIQCIKTTIERERLLKNKCYVCGKIIRILTGTIKSDGKSYCSLKCLNKDICRK